MTDLFQMAGIAALAGIVLGLFVWLMWSFVENLAVYLQSKPAPVPADAAKKKEEAAKTKPKK